MNTAVAKCKAAERCVYTHTYKELLLQMCRNIDWKSKKYTILPDFKRHPKEKADKNSQRDILFKSI